MENIKKYQLLPKLWQFLQNVFSWKRFAVTTIPVERLNWKHKTENNSLVEDLVVSLNDQNHTKKILFTNKKVFFKKNRLFYVKKNI